MDKLSFDDFVSKYISEIKNLMNKNEALYYDSENNVLSITTMFKISANIPGMCKNGIQSGNGIDMGDRYGMYLNDYNNNSKSHSVFRIALMDVMESDRNNIKFAANNESLNSLFKSYDDFSSNIIITLHNANECKRYEELDLMFTRLDSMPGVILVPAIIKLMPNSSPILGKIKNQVITHFGKTKNKIIADAINNTVRMLKPKVIQGTRAGMLDTVISNETAEEYCAGCALDKNFLHKIAEGHKMLISFSSIHEFMIYRINKNDDVDLIAKAMEVATKETKGMLDCSYEFVTKDTYIYDPSDRSLKMYEYSP